jgi:hypothetical protein
VRRRRIILTLALSTILCAATGAASVAAPNAALGLRHTVVRTDGRDTNGPLDLRWLKLVHLGPRFDRLWLSTWGPVTNAELNPAHRGNFAVGIDLNNVGPVRYEYWIYVDVVKGRLRGLLVRPGSNRAVMTPVQRVGPREFWVDVPWRAMGRPDSYRFALYSYYAARPCASPHRPCVDKMPNRLPLILQDLTSPTVTWHKSLPDSATVSVDLTYPARFTVSDDKRGSGVKRWELQRQAFGSSGWRDVAGGTKASPTVSVPGHQGRAYHLRVVATDRAGNTTVSASKTVIFPVDDQNTSAVQLLGTWTQTIGSPTSFLGTTSSSSTLTDTATFSFTGGSRVCVLGMPVATGATAGVTLDELATADVSETASTSPRGVLHCYKLGGDDIPHLLVLSVSAGPDPFVLDGFEVVP